MGALRGPVRAMLAEWRGLGLPGGVGATVFGALSFTPSLLPRDWELQGLVAGLSAGFGYALGSFVGWLARGFIGHGPQGRTLERLRLALTLIATPVLAVAVWQGWQWQDEIHRRMQTPQPGKYSWVLLVLLALAILRVVIAVGRVLRRLYRWFDRRLRRLVPQRVAAPLAALLVLAVLYTVNDGLVWRVTFDLASATAGRLNDSTLDGVVRPTASQYSGSPASLIRWDTMGKQGRTFVSDARTTSELRRFSGRGAMRPIRIYAGLSSADGLEAEATLAVRDLRRAGGFRRAVIVVAGTTGTGWVDPAAIDAIEYMYNGDVATVAMQYSYLWSALSFLVDGDRAREAGADLFNAVYDVWARLPKATRPRLVVTGTSLATAGMEGAFSGLADMQNRTDGVVLAGAPVFAKLHAQLVRDRDAGSLERKPVYRGGTIVRFGDQASDWAANPAAWTRPRVLYLQHGSDPIVAWSPQLVWTRPRWMEEPYASDVLPEMRWIPVVTFSQVTADMPFSLHAGPGHGHNYRAAFPAAWAAVVPPAGWTDADTARLTRLLG